MRKFYATLVALLIALAFLPPGQVKASHVMGSDITWKCIGKDTFEITVTAYRNCTGIELSGGGINFKSACGGAAVGAGGELSGGQDITPVCRKSCTQCKDAGCEFKFGIEQYTITTTIILSQYNCCEFTVSWGQCCRNAQITTGASGADYYVEGKLNKCAKPCDNSPYFTNPPVAIYCINTCVVFNPGVNDVDLDYNGQADSLSYEFADPLSGPGQAISYNDGYAKDHPLMYDGYPDPKIDFDPPKKCKGFYLDPETGDLMFKATQEDQTVMAIKVTAYRKDSLGKYQKIAEIRRDLQIAIISCPKNASPILTGINGTPQVTMDFCAGQTKCFTVYSFDPDGDSVTMTSNVAKAIPGAKFEVETGSKYPKGQFCWTPTNANVRSYPYRFVVTGIDDACPVSGRTSRTFSIKVNPSPEASWKVEIDKCGWVTFTAVPDGKTAIAKYEWSGSVGRGRPPMRLTGNPVKYQFPAPGKYVFSLQLTAANGCKNAYTDSLKIPDFVWVQLPYDSAVCDGATINLNAKRYLGTAPYTYQWGYGKGANAKSISGATTLDLKNIKITRDTIFWIKVLDAVGCINYDTIYIRNQKPPKPNLGFDQRNCKGKIVELDGGKGLAKMKSYAWYSVTGLGKSTPILSGDEKTARYLKVKDSGTYWVLVTDTVGCTGVDSVNIYFNPLVDVVPKDFKGCNGDLVTLDANQGISDDGTVTYQWYDLRYPNRLVSSGKTYSWIARGNPTGKFIISYRVLAKGQDLPNLKPYISPCTDEDTITLTIYPKPIVKAGKLQNQCVDYDEYNLGVVASSPIGGEWTYPKKPQVFLSKNIISPKALGVGKFYLYYTYTDENNCSTTDSSLLIVDTLPNIDLKPDTFVCIQNGPMPLTAGPSGGTWSTDPPGGKYVKGILNPYFDPSEVDQNLIKEYTVVYTVKGKTSAQCDAEKKMVITVYPTLKPKAGTYGPYCENDAQEVTLGGTPLAGTWFSTLPADAFYLDGADNRYKFIPNKAGVGKHKLWYTVSHIKGRCPVTDTTYIDVVPQPKPKITNTKTTFCISDAPTTVNVNLPGGQYTSPTAKLLGNTFDPARAGAGKHQITYFYEDPTTHCQNTDKIEFEVTDTPWLQIVSSPKLCSGAAYDVEVLTANIPNGQLEWTTADGTGYFEDKNAAKTVFHPSTAHEESGTFTLIVTSKLTHTFCNPAEVQRVFEISPTPTPEFDAQPLNGCGPLAVTFNNKSTVNGNPDDIGFSVWSYGDGSKDDTVAGVNPAIHVYTKAGKYDVKLTVYSAAAGCKAEIEKKEYIEVFSTPIPNFRAKPTFTTIAFPKIEFINMTLENAPSDDIEYTWNFGDPHADTKDGGVSKERNPSYLYTDTGKYTVTLTAFNKKTKCDSTIVKVNYIDIRPEIIVFIPNVFTPSTNGRKLGPEANNKFTVIASSISSFEMLIYNRWGELLYRTENVNEGWDGKYNNEDCQMDAYIYVVKAQSYSGKEYKYTGTVTLLR